MATEVVVPPVGESITSVTLLEWHKNVGDEVHVGDVLAEIETDKAAVSVECPADGVVLAVLVPEGETVEVGRLLAVIGAAGESWTPVESWTAGESRTPVEPAEVRSAPSARRLARELGIDIREVAGSLGGRRVTEPDVREFVSSRLADPVPRERGRVVTLSRIRTVVAERMSESARTVPQFSASLQIDAEPMLAARAGEGGRASITALLIQAACRAIDSCPMANARHLDRGRALVFDERNIAVAAATADGLVAPVIRGADGLTPMEISERLSRLVEKARAGTLDPEDSIGATFTLSNLGALGAHLFTPMVVPGQSAILGVGEIRRVPIVTESGAVDAGHAFTATLAADHRLLDGADAMTFLKSMKAALETL